MSSSPSDLPIDSTSVERLSQSGLRFGLVDTSDRPGFESWLRADMRGFHAGDLSDDLLAAYVAGVAYRRTSGVWDDTAADPATPVATVSSWRGELTVPGSRAIPSWAISSVTVAPTHRRKGIARELLQSELRTAAALGLPVAMLTVSESTIYGRFGFAPAAFATEWRIDRRRTNWTGPSAGGRVHFIKREQFRELVAPLHERTRLAVPGQIDVWDLRWDEISGSASDNSERTKNLRAVRYDDETGALRGLALYRVSGGEEDFTAHTLTVEYLLTETPDAYAALWRFLLEVDLVSEVKANLRSVDEPLRWQLSDQRGATVTTSDHQWIRILDVATALEVRSFAAPGRFVLEIDDALDYASGRFAVEIADGAARVSTTKDAADLVMSANELAALYLGGVSAATLVLAGRIVEGRVGAAAELDVSFRSTVTPWLSIWY